MIICLISYSVYKIDVIRYTVSDHLIQRHTFQKISKSSVVVMKPLKKLLRYDVVVNKYAPCLNCVKDDYTNVMLF